MKIEGFDIKKWYHWLAAVIVLALLVFLALLLAQGIICWACRPVGHVTVEKPAAVNWDLAVPGFPIPAVYPGTSDNSTIELPLPAAETPLNLENIPPVSSSDNCSPGG